MFTKPYRVIGKRARSWHCSPPVDVGATDMRALVGQNFVRLRKRFGLSQKQCAERSRFSQQYLSDLEHGRRNPTIVTVYALAQLLGVSHIELLRPPRPKRGGFGPSR